MTDRDDARFADDDLDPAERALAVLLTSVMAAQASTIVLAEEVFEPARPLTLDSDEAPSQTALGRDGVLDADHIALEPLPIAPARSQDRRWIVWVAGAAAAAVLLAALVMVNVVRQPSLQVGGELAPQPPTAEVEGAWAPTAVPDGFELYRVDVVPSTVISDVSGAGSGAPAPPTIEQLVTSSDGRTRLLLAAGGSADSFVTGGPKEPMQIRGVEGWSRPLLSPTTGTQLGWQERGIELTAKIDNPDIGPALALLEGLVPADAADAGAGLAAPDASATVLTDRVDDAPEVWSSSVTYGYSTTRPVNEQLGLTVASQGPMSGAGPRSAGMSTYLATAFRGDVRPDGMAFAFSAGAASTGGGAPSGYAVWPDGRSVYVAGDDLDPERAAAIAASVAPISGADLGRLRVEVSDRIGSGPVLARAELPSGTVEVIGDAEPMGLCLTVDGYRRCSLSDRMAGASGSVPGPTQFGFAWEVVDGRWFLFGANEGPVDITVELGSDSGTTTGTGPPDPSVRPETATDGTWTVALLVVPDGFDGATIASPNRSMGLARPTP